MSYCIPLRIILFISFFIVLWLEGQIYINKVLDEKLNIAHNWECKKRGKIEKGPDQNPMFLGRQRASLLDCRVGHLPTAIDFTGRFRSSCCCRLSSIWNRLKRSGRLESGTWSIISAPVTRTLIMPLRK